MRIENNGTVWTFTPEGDFEYEWLTLNTDAEPWQWLGRSLVVDWRPARVLAEAIIAEGFVVEGVRA